MPLPWVMPHHPAFPVPHRLGTHSGQAITFRGFFYLKRHLMFFGSSRICGKRRLDGNQTILVWGVLASTMVAYSRHRARAGSSGYRFPFPSKGGPAMHIFPQIRDEPKLITAGMQGGLRAKGSFPGGFFRSCIRFRNGRRRRWGPGRPGQVCLRRRLGWRRIRRNEIPLSPGFPIARRRTPRSGKAHCSGRFGAWGGVRQRFACGRLSL